ncbi:hypothetical protein ABVT39_017810 [Epinephelus coioides]
MQCNRDIRRNRRMVRQQPRVRPLDAALMECDELRNQVQHLHNLLYRERQENKQLSQELDETKQQLAKQKSLKEMYINREKESRREFERVKKYADPETLSTYRLAVQVNDIKRQKKKKDLHKDYEQLRVAHIISQEKFTAELDIEKQRNKLLQEEVERTRVSYHDMKVKYETQILTLQQQAELLQREHDIQIQAHADRVASDQQMMQNLKSAQDAVVDKMAEEMRILQKNALADQTAFRTQTEELMSQLNSQISLNHELSMGLKAEREHDCRHDEQRQQEPLPDGVAVKDLDQAEVSDDTVPPEANKQETIPERSTTPMEMDEVSQMDISETTKGQPSVWKNSRPFLGMKKPKRWWKNTRPQN